MALPYTISSLHESALLISWGNRIDAETHARVMALYQSLTQNKIAGVQELVPAFSSLAVYYDPALIRKTKPGQTAFATLMDLLEDRMANHLSRHHYHPREMRIPVYYTAKGTDLEAMAAEKRLAPEEIIFLHTQQVYDVYMLGFLPGFAYMAAVDERIAMPRKPKPRPVKAGSVGIAGLQTGIYPLDAPGGWQLIGQTPLTLFDSNNETSPCLLQAGDRVQFYSITRDEFESSKSRTAG
jgi:inhibitor of KinA